MVFGLFGKRIRERRRRRAAVEAVFARLADASRRPALYIEGAIPDSFEGRFEALTLHVFLLLRRLRQLPPPAEDFAQDLVDACFAYLELGFRNGGVSDIAVPKRMKKIGRSFYGRLQAYEKGFAETGSDGQALAAALARNAAVAEPEGGDGRAAQALAAYVRAAWSHLSGLDLDAILGEEALFPDWPGTLTVEDRSHV